MTGTSDSIPRRIRAEAATWLARMRSDARDADDEADFRDWLDRDVRHADAFGTVTSVWEEAGGAAAGLDRTYGRPRVSRRALLAAGLAALALPAGGWWYLNAPSVFTTTVGEQRRFVLDDGSAAMLDTDTEIRVRFNGDRRLVELVRGRAYFAVAKDLLRPFHVRSGERQVVAIGTAFDVEKAGGALTVVLLEGRVAVQPIAQAAPAQTVMMAPGERLRWTPGIAPRVDRPDLSASAAWHTGRAVFNDIPLGDAVAQINRYSRRPVIVTDPELAARHISGTYRTSDPEAFARSAATLFSGSVDITASRIFLRPAAF